MRVARSDVPDDAGASWFAAMARGDFPAAWQVSDHVLATRDPAEQDDPTQPYHLRWVWDGTPVDGRDVLVRCYHGLGDTVQFCRYLPALRARATRVTLEVQAELLPLMELIGAADRIVPFDQVSPCPPLPGRGIALEIMELAHALRIAPQPLPYLPIMRARIPGPIRAKPARIPGPIRAGLCWQARAGWRPERSMPEALVATLAMEGLALQSLQLGSTPRSMAPCPVAVLDTARVIAGLDVVITVDTMVAHLAGAIGVPVWLMLDTVTDWRWIAGTDESSRGSPWYRGVRKYWQREPGAWQDPVMELVSDLTRWVGAGSVDFRIGS